MKDYIEQAAVTCSDEYHGELVPMRVMNGAIKEFIDIGHKLDTIKKSLFYGKPNAFARIAKEPDCSQAQSKQTQDVIHGMLGCATESVELLENLARGGFDPVNIKEECGDILWYIAILARACNFTIEECMEVNIAKLRSRYGEKFTAYDALNRNLDAERTILETSIDPNATIINPRP